MKNPIKSINETLDEPLLQTQNKMRCHSLEGEVLTEITKNPNYIKPTKHECKQCDYITYSKQNLLKHLLTQKHKTVENNPPKNINQYTYICTCCNYNTFHKNDYDKHLNTSKHKKLSTSQTITSNEISQENTNKMHYECKCCKYETTNKQHYGSHIKTKKHQTNINNTTYQKTSNHVQPNTMANIILEETTSSNDIVINKEIFYTIIKQNEDFKQLLLEQNDKLIDLAKREHNVNSHNTTHNNQHFNLNFFLNEQCKDALNLTDFIESINPSFQDLEYVGKNGYVSGITKIIMDSLSQLDIYKRPVHCTDVKREVIHVKDDDKWDRDTEDNKKIRKLIDSVADKNLKLVSPWVTENPDSRILDTPKYNLWFKIMKQSLNVKQENKNNNDVLKNIAKNVYVNKALT